MNQMVIKPKTNRLNCFLFKNMNRFEQMKEKT